jgi:hypothetical protein
MDSDNIQQLYTIQNRYDSGIYEVPDYLVGLLENMPDGEVPQNIMDAYGEFNQEAGGSFNSQMNIQDALRQKIDILESPFDTNSLTKVADKEGNIWTKGIYNIKLVDGKLVAQSQRKGEEPKTLTLETDNKGRLLFKEEYQYSDDNRPVFWIQNIESVYKDLANKKIETTLNQSLTTVQ